MDHDKIPIIADGGNASLQLQDVQRAAEIIKSLHTISDTITQSIPWASLQETIKSVNMATTAWKVPADTIRSLTKTLGQLSSPQMEAMRQTVNALAPSLRQLSNISFSGQAMQSLRDLTHQTTEIGTLVGRSMQPIIECINQVNHDFRIPSALQSLASSISVLDDIDLTSRLMAPELSEYLEQVRTDARQQSVNETTRWADDDDQWCPPKYQLTAEEIDSIAERASRQAINDYQHLQYANHEETQKTEGTSKPNKAFHVFFRGITILGVIVEGFQGAYWFVDNGKRMQQDTVSIIRHVEHFMRTGKMQPFHFSSPNDE